MPYWTNESLFDLAVKPDHLLILGGGPIGLEMADAFCGLGCRVTLIDAATIGGKEDPELVAGLRLALAARGVIFREGLKPTGVAPGVVPGSSQADRGRWRTGSQVSGSHLLVAVGRTPNLAALDLAAGNIQAGRPASRQTAVCAGLTNRRVYAVGDNR